VQYAVTEMLEGRRCAATMANRARRTGLQHRLYEAAALRLLSIRIHSPVWKQ
jgi:hypothetical protein